MSLADATEGVGMEVDQGLTGVTTPGILAAYTTALLLFPASYQVGEFFAQMHLPTISGYLVTGVLCGPHGLGVLSKDAADQLWLADDLCLAAISIAAGSQLMWSEVRTNLKTVSILGAGVLCFTWTACLMAMFVIAEHVDFLKHLSEGAHISASVMSATVMVARSPASAIAVMRELDAKGPFSTVVLTVAILIDVVVIVVFSLSVEYAHSVHGGSDFNVLMSSLVPILHLLLALVLGACLGQIMMEILTRGRMFSPEARAVAILGLAGSWYYVVQDVVHSEPLLTCVVAGVWATNRAHYKLDDKTSHLSPTATPSASSKGDAETGSNPSSPCGTESVVAAPLSSKHKLSNIIGLSLPWINVAFFTLGGAALDLDALSKTMTVSIFLFCSRLLALFTGASVGSYLAGWPSNLVRVCWMSFVTQAGVSLGLAKEVADTFPDWGDSLCNLLVSVIVLNQLVGPPLFKLALIQAGEANPAKLKSKNSGVIPGFTESEMDQKS